MRNFVDPEVLPIINDYWEPAQFPFEPVQKIAKLGVVGGAITGYGCPGLSRLAAGMLTFEPVALSEPSINPAWMILMNLISSRASASDQAPALQPPVKYRRRRFGRVVWREDVRRPAVRGPPEMGCYVTVMRPRAHRSEGNSRIAI